MSAMFFVLFAKLRWTRKRLNWNDSFVSDITYKRYGVSIDNLRVKFAFWKSVKSFEHSLDKYFSKSFYRIEDDTIVTTNDLSD